MGDHAAVIRFYETNVKAQNITLPTNFLSKLRFNWNRNRYLWRIMLVYQIMVYSIASLCLGTWIWYFYARRMRCTTYARCGWFHDYECSSRRLYFATYSLFAGSWVLFTQLVFAVFEISVLKIFLNTTIREVQQAASKKQSRVGCLAKFTPWVIAVFQLLWLFAIGSSAIFLMIGGCNRKLNFRGVQAVLNCRLFFEKCCDADGACQMALRKKDVYQCNSLIFLQSYNFLRDPRPVGTVNAICSHVSGVVEEATVMRQYEPLAPFNDTDVITADCAGFTIDQCFILEGLTSDFGKSFILFGTGSLLLWLITTLTLILVKVSTPVESVFFQASNEREFILIRAIRKALTPWG